ncbi:hypothetical protein HS041_06945 [Planomonospora sp. ID67723]|uniref:flagellin n=1 Tax=Planomonospora sp. ID67723 TaxID=2738134 RepID=UPI0018C3F2ED|nr:flagellin [Planomonospora sp. ID67723]MBG0827497.1 hypothetical protein [Planomonospora sp. ID67723]
MGLRINQHIGTENVHHRSPAGGTAPRPPEGPPGGLGAVPPVSAAAESSAPANTRADDLRAAVRSAQDGISIVQTVEEALAQAHSVLQHMRGLATQAAADGGTRDPREQQAADKQFIQLRGELDRIVSIASGAGEPLGGASSGVLRAETAGIGRQLSTGRGIVDTAALDLGSASLVDTTSPGDRTSNAAAAHAAVTSVDTAIQAISDTRAKLGAIRNHFEHAISSLNTAIGALSASESRRGHTAAAEKAAAATRDQIAFQAQASIAAQANQAPRSALKLLS